MYYVMVLVAQLCLTLCDRMDCSLPGSSVHGILQAGILEWAVASFLQRIFPTQGLNSGLLHCRQILYHLSHQEKETTENEMVGWHHQINGHESEQTPGDSEGQGSLACYSPWGRRVGHNLATEQQQQLHKNVALKRMQ